MRMGLVLGMVCVLVLGACGGGGDDDGDSPGVVCGDSVCEGGESAATCANDCGAGCSTAPDSCSGSNICDNTGVCADAFNRVYALQITSVVFGQRDLTGECWDLACNPPDPLAEVRVGNQVVYTTQSLQDTYTGNFEFIDVTLIAGSSLFIDIYDEDASSNDLGLTCSLDPVDPVVLRQRSFHCDGTAVTLDATIAPK